MHASCSRFVALPTVTLGVIGSSFKEDISSTFIIMFTDDVPCPTLDLSEFICHFLMPDRSVRPRPWHRLMSCKLLFRSRWSESFQEIIRPRTSFFLLAGRGATDRISDTQTGAPAQNEDVAMSSILQLRQLDHTSPFSWA